MKTLIFLLGLFSLLSCGGHNKNNGSPPNINCNSSYIEPSSAPHGNVISAYAALSWCDPDGDLKSFNLSYDGQTFTIPISDAASITCGNTAVTGDIPLNSTIGYVDFTVWLVDNANNKSNSCLGRIYQY